MGLFGPSKKEVWRQLASEIQGDYIESGFLKVEKVQANIDNWIVLFDTYSVSEGETSTTYTRIRAPFKNLESFYFKVHRKGLFSGVGKLLGAKDISIGYSDFDYEFIVKGNNEKKVIQLFSNERIRELVELQKSINLEIKDNEGLFKNYLPSDVDELYFSVTGVIKDLQRLKELYELFAEVLRELCSMGIASNEQVEVNLR